MSALTFGMHTEHLLSSESHWAKEMWQASNAFYISTASTTTAVGYTTTTAVGYIRRHTKTEDFQ